VQSLADVNNCDQEGGCGLKSLKGPALWHVLPPWVEGAGAMHTFPFFRGAELHNNQRAKLH
jgi:hypothetical protein